MIVIEIPGYAGFAELRSDTGRVVSGRLDGPFHISFLGHRTGTVEFNGSGDVRVSVTGKPGSYRVAQAQATLFAFAGEIGDAASAPRLAASDLWIAKKSGTSRAALGFGRASLSFIGSVEPDPSTAKICSPSAALGGWTETGVDKVRDPVTGLVAFIVEPTANGYELRFGPRGNQFNISHIQAAVVQVGKDAELRHVVSDPGGGSVSRTVLKGVAPDLDKKKQMFLVLPKARGLQLQTQASAKPSAPSTITIESGLLTVANFHGGRTVASILGKGLAQSAALEGDASNFQFALRLPVTAGQLPHGSLAQLIFTDPRVISGRNYLAISERFDGLTVAGLSSVRTSRERLDCSHATVTLNASDKFVLRAGLRLEYLDGSIQPSPKLMAKQGNNGKRRFEMPVGAMRLVFGEAFSIDTDDGFSIAEARLEGRPNGPAGVRVRSRQNVAENYASFTLGRATPMLFDFKASGIVPREKNWLQTFDYASDQSFRLLDHPGFGYTLRRLPDPSTPRLSNEERRYERHSKTEMVEHRDANGQDVLAVSTLVASLSYLAIRYFQAAEGETFIGEKEFKINLRLVDGEKLKSYVESAAADDIRVIFRGNEPESVAAMDDFINVNLNDASPGARKILFPLGPGLAVLLRQTEGGVTQSAFDVARARKSTAATLFAFDFSNVVGLGLDWDSLARDDKYLWPSLSAVDTKARDPSHPEWKGFFFRDLALNLNIPSEALALIYKDFPHLKNLVEAFNQALVLDYGWLDSSGASWSSRLEPVEPIQLCGEDLVKYLSIEVEEAVFQGFAGTTKRAGAKIRVSLPFLAENDGDEPPALIGDFDFNFGADDPFGRVAMRGREGPIATKSIPGFDEVRLAGFSTDFKTAQADLEFTPSDKLKSLIDAFDLPEGTPFQAAVAYNLKDEKPGALSLVTKHEIRTKLLGKWPLVIQAIRIELDADPRLTFTGRVELGLPNLRSFGVRVLLGRKGDDWDYQLLPESIEGELGFAGIGVKAKLEWRNDDEADREFWGEMTISGGPLDPKTSDGEPFSLAFRTGAAGGRPFWIAGSSLPRLDLGVASVDEPLLVVGHGAALANLTEVIADPSKNLRVLRDSKPAAQGTEKQKGDRAWLKEWQPSASVGTVVALSGYLEFDERVAGSAKSKDDSSGRYLTNLIFTDNGQLRLDAWLKLMSSDALMTRFFFGLDTKAKIISAGAQLPGIKIPETGKTEIEIHPGFVFASINYSGDRYFKYSLGWPDRVDGPGLERDWSKSTKVMLAEAWPINTFWGGLLVEYREGQSLTVGIAVRAGWTWSYKGGAAGVASAEAELGVTLGGVLILTLGKPQVLTRLPAPAAHLLLTQLPVQKLPLSPSDEDEIAAAALAAAPFLEALDRRLIDPFGLPELHFTAELYGDLWGRGSAVFMGVTIASVKVAAYARYAVTGNTQEGIKTMRSITGYKVEVEILCVRYEAWVEVEVWVIRR